jgi:hypothetical protein
MISVEVDDSAEQTRRVIEMVAEVEGFNLAIGHGSTARWRDYQRWLAARECRVIVPWSTVLTQLIPDTKAVRLRRDVRQLLYAIKAHALLHRHHRRRSRKGAVVADIEADYAPVRQLMAELLATASEMKIRPEIIETVQAVRELQVDEPNPEADPLPDGVTVREISASIGLDMSSARRRLNGAEQAGLVVNLETRPRRPGRYKVTDDVPNVTSTVLLPKTKALREAYDASREGTKAARA